MAGTPASARRLALVLVATALALPPAQPAETAADSQEPPATQPAPPVPTLLSPTLGRPAFVTGGDLLAVTAQLPEAAEPAVFALVSQQPPTVRRGLTPEGSVADRPAAGAPVLLRLPADLPARTYDLEIDCGDVSLCARHCVAVGPVGDRIRLVHLSNMNIGDVGAPQFDERLIDEVNLLAPTLIVLTGDLIDATHEDPAEGWRQVVEFLGRFEAPTLAACGDHDDLAYYSRHLAPSPVGAIDVGRARGVVLYDVPARPLTADAAQLQWLEHTLTVPGDDRPTFVVAHDDCPNLLRAWQRRGVLAEMVRATRLGLWFSGGHRDWDGIEYADLATAAAPMLYIRTHQASTAACEGATGASHYRVVELAGDRVRLVGPPDGGSGLPPSIPVGGLHVSFAGPNDGSDERVAFTAVNTHRFCLDGLSVRVLLARSDSQRPWCIGAELVSAWDLGTVWECRVRFDLPDQGSLRAVVGTGAIPTVPAVDVLFDVGERLTLKQRQSDDGLVFLTAVDGPGEVALIHLVNRGQTPAEVTPLVRLDGTTLSYLVLDEPGPAATAYHLRLAPERTLTLQLDLSAIRVAPGRHTLQVYLKGAPAWRPVCQPLEVTVAP